MARTSAIALLSAVNTKAELGEVYGIVIESTKKDTLSSILKSQKYTGNPASGSAEFRRFQNSESKDYGTARTAGKGDAITLPPVTVNLDKHKEIVEECAKFDLDTVGVTDVMKRRAADHIDTLSSTLDIAFFDTATTDGKIVLTTSSTAAEKLEEAIVKLETTQNEYVRGVKRNMIVACVSPAYYSAIRTALDSLPTSNVDTAAEEFAMYHGVKVYSTINLTAGYNAVVMALGSIAEPVVINQYGEPEKIPFSADYAVSMFFDFGVKSLTPDLIYKLADLATLTVTSTAGAATNGTLLTISPASAGTGYSYVYKLGTAAETFSFDDVLTGWTAFTTSEIAASTNTVVTVAKIITTSGKAVGRGTATLVKKA